LLTFTPAADQSGTAQITVTVADDGGTASGGVDTFQQTFQVTIHPVNDPPFVIDPIAPIVVVENSLLTVVGLDAYFGDADLATGGDWLQYGVAIEPAIPGDSEYDAELLVASIVGRGLQLDYVPGRTGHVDVTVQTLDQGRLTAQTTVRVMVTPASNSVPTVVDAIDDFSVEAGQPALLFDLSQVFADADVVAGTDSLGYSVTNANPALLHASLSGSLLNLSFISGQVGAATITAQATDSRGAQAGTSFVVTVAPANNPPTAAPIPPVAVDEDAADLVFSLRDFFSDVEDPDENLVLDVALASSSQPNPVAFALDPNTGQLRLSFAAEASGSAQYNISARDTGGKTAATALAVTVNPVNDAPRGPAAPVERTLWPSIPETVIELRACLNDVEDGSDLAFEVLADSLTNPALFDGPPTVDADGYLRLHTAAGVSGTSDLTIRTTDSGGATTLATWTFATAAPEAVPPATVTIIDTQDTGEIEADGLLVVQRTGDLGVALDVPYALAGTAAYGIDYTTSWPPSGTLQFPVGEATVTIAVDPTEDADAEDQETIRLRLGDGPGYVLGAHAAGSVRLENAAPTVAPGPTVVLSAPATIGEAVPFRVGVGWTGGSRLRVTGSNIWVGSLEEATPWGTVIHLAINVTPDESYAGNLHQRPGGN
jgi:hypothetical protein